MLYFRADPVTDGYHYAVSDGAGSTVGLNNPRGWLPNTVLATNPPPAAGDLSLLDYYSSCIQGAGYTAVEISSAPPAFPGAY